MPPPPTTTPATPAWSPGATVGAYTLLAKLATGGMAEIWLARQVGLRGFERVVVIKRIIESLSEDPGFVEMFLDEARIAAQLAHPNIVQIYDLGEHAGAYYIAMEYLPGEHLASVARTAAKVGAPLSLGFAVKVAVAALEGLAHAHARVGLNGKPLNLVHRDVSPQNIVVTWDAQVKLVDFGIARAANRATQTQGGKLKGKFAYMAPEQAHGGAELDGRADLFAIGIILFELATHTRLWAMEDQVKILTALINPAPIQAAHERNPAVPLDLSALIMRALEKDPADRWQTALEFKQALEEWLREHGGGPSTTEVSQLMQRLFQARIAQRARLIEQAGKGDLTPARVDEVMRPPTLRSMPGATPVGPLAALPRWKLLAGAGAGALVVAAVALGWWAFAPSAPLPEPVAEVKQAPPPPPPPVAPAPKPSAIVVETEPPGAAVRLDGREAGTAPLTLGDVAVGAHVVEATLAGYEPLKRTVSLAEPGERLLVVLPLVAQAKPKAPAAAPPAGRGRLTLSTDPWTRVSLNNRVLGQTPLIEVPLPAGRHLLRLVNEDRKVDVAIEVEVKAGQLTKKVLRL